MTFVLERDTKQTWHLLQKEIFSLLPWPLAIEIILGKNSPELVEVNALLIRHEEMWEIYGELLFTIFYSTFSDKCSKISIWEIIPDLLQRRRIMGIKNNWKIKLRPVRMKLYVNSQGIKPKLSQIYSFIYLLINVKFPCFSSKVLIFIKGLVSKPRYAGLAFL